jgi:hypothetical protein
LAHLSSSTITEVGFTATGSGGREWRVGTGDSTAGLSGGFRFFDVTANATRLFINSSGNVSIGTGNTDYKVDIAPEAVGGTLRLRGNSGGTNIIQFTDSGASAQWGTITTTASSLDISHSAVLRFNTASSERARLTGDGKFLVGTSSSLQTKYQASTFQPGFQSAATSGTGGFFRYSADSDGAAFVLSKSRNASLGSQTALVNGDTVGYLGFAGSDGTAFQTAATILSQVDGTPGTDDMPGRLVFSTTADGAASPTERMRISSTGAVTFTGAVTIPAGASIAGYETLPTITTTATSKTLVNRERCTVTAAGQTITLPASPSAGWEVSITNASGGTDTIIARNSSNIMSLAENMTLDVANVTVTLYYVDATRGWRTI